MAASSSVGGYDCELFLSPVPEELKCGLCKKVAREPNLTSCCTENRYCKVCITLFVDDRKPCPSCKEAEFMILTDKRDFKKILALEVQCSTKDRGCDWTGALEQLDAHLDVNSDNCQYIDVKCPNKCEQPVQKCHLPTHLANECSKRDFFCQYCNFTATYEVVCNDHWPQCPFYPVPCPNGCEIMAIERGDLDAHLMLCSLEVVECDFSYAGCNAKLVREEMEKHLADNLQRHMLMMNKALQGKIEEKERKIEQLEEKGKELQEQVRQRDQQIQELRDEKDRQIQELRDEKDRQIQEQVRQRDQRLQELREEKDKQMQALETDMTKRYEQKIQETQAKVVQVEAQLTAHIENYNHGKTCIAQVTVDDFRGKKARNHRWDSPPLYTHPGGYWFTIWVWPNGYVKGRGTHVSVRLLRAKGDHDASLKWPADCTFTIQLLNQHRDQDHITISQRCQWDRTNNNYVYYITPPFADRFIAHKNLDWNTEKQTQFLKNDSLEFRITNIQVHSL